MFWTKVMAMAAAVSAAMLAGGGGVATFQHLAAAGEAPGSVDWPQWRGPNRDGVAPGSPKLLDEWPAGGPRLLWKTPTVGSGRDGGASCPVIVGGKVYIYANQYTRGRPDKKLITTEVLDRLKAKKGGRRFNSDELNRLATLRDKDFKSVAEFYEAVEKRVGLADGGDAALWYEAVEDAFVLNDMVHCLDAATGEEVWRWAQPAKGLRAPANWSLWGASGTPAVSGGSLVMQGSVALYCLSIRDGSLIWRVKTGFSNSSPLIVGNMVFAGAEPRTDEPSGVSGRIGGAWTAYDLATGRLLWRSKAGGSEWGASLFPWNVGGRLMLLAIGPVCIDPASGDLLGAPGRRDRVSCWATPAVAGDVVVSRSESRLRAFRIALPGMERLWESRLGGNEFESASPLIYRGHVYMAARQSLRCLDLKTGEQKWIAPKEVDPETSTPLVVDGKLIANVGSNHAATNRTIMLRASPEKCEILGKIANRAAPCTSPVVSAGRLYVRLVDGIACYDLIQYVPYAGRTTVTRDKVVFDFEQAEGGLSLERSSGGAVKGLTVEDASGDPKPASARIDRSSLSVDIAGLTFPLRVSYDSAAGNLRVRDGPSASFEWQSPRLAFEKWAGDTITLRLDRPAENGAWRAAKSYAVTGPQAVRVEVDERDDRLVRLVTDGNWKTGDKVTVRYPALPERLPGRAAQLTFALVPGDPVGDMLLQEFLIGEVREKIDPRAAFGLDDLDRHVKPAAGGKWKLYHSDDGQFDLNRCLRPLENALAHACVYVHSDTPRRVQLWAGSDDGLEISVNGKVVHRNPVGRGLTPDQDKVEGVRLAAGWNTILLGISQGGGGCGFCLRIRNERGDGRPAGLTYTAELPGRE